MRESGLAQELYSGEFDNGLGLQRAGEGVIRRAAFKFMVRSLSLSSSPRHAALSAVTHILRHSCRQKGVGFSCCVCVLRVQDKLFQLSMKAVK